MNQPKKDHIHDIFQDHDCSYLVSKLRAKNATKTRLLFFMLFAYLCDQKQLSSAEDYAFYDENAKKLLSNPNSQNFQEMLLKAL